MRLHHTLSRTLPFLTLLATLSVGAAPAARGVTIDMVTVGDPGNAGQTLTYANGGSLTFGRVD